jgi:mannose-6-phosphate isomerase-like protein (cupin superfamily)
MQITNATDANSGARQLGPGVRLVPLYPMSHADSALLAVDLLEVDAGSETQATHTGADQVLYVLSGRGQVASAGGSSALVGPGAVVHLSQGESATIRATGNEPLRVLSSSSLLFRAPRLAAGEAPTPARPRELRPQPALPVDSAPALEPEAAPEPPTPTMADISAMM